MQNLYLRLDWCPAWTWYNQPWHSAYMMPLAFHWQSSPAHETRLSGSSGTSMGYFPSVHEHKCRTCSFLLDPQMPEKKFSNRTYRHQREFVTYKATQFLLFFSSVSACLFLSLIDITSCTRLTPAEPISTGMKSPALICCSDKGQTADCVEWALSHYAPHETGGPTEAHTTLKAATHTGMVHV